MSVMPCDGGIYFYITVGGPWDRNIRYGNVGFLDLYHDGGRFVVFRILQRPSAFFFRLRKFIRIIP
jgi:hypothetical protein